MKSDLPKVLCQVSGRPLIEYVLDSLRSAGVQRIIVVVGYREETVKSTLADWDLEYASQTEQLGTGHAVMVCRDLISDLDGPLIVVAGDSPMLQADSIRHLINEFDSGRPACVLGTLVHDQPEGLGRIVRDEQGNFVGIVEQKDATPEQAAIREVNMSTYLFDCQPMLQCLDDLTDDNKQREYYITDVPGIMLSKQWEVRALPVLKPVEALSVNTVEQLAEVEAFLKRSEGSCES